MRPLTADEMTAIRDLREAAWQVRKLLRDENFCNYRMQLLSEVVQIITLSSLIYQADKRANQTLANQSTRARAGQDAGESGEKR